MSAPDSPVKKELSGRVLLLDDDRGQRDLAAEFLRSLGLEVDDVDTLQKAIGRAATRPYDLVLSDLMLGEGTGIDLLEELRRREIACEVIIMTGFASVDFAVQAIRKGAYDFVTKPLDLTRLEIDVRRAIEKGRLERDLARLSEAAGSGFGGMIGVSPAMQPVIRLLRRAATTDSNVLLLGESGTGKEVAARAIHESSSRSAGPFTAVNCGALPENLLESELFGHRKGAFTGAERDRSGVFAASSGGTLFLDEIGCAPPNVQVSLLRVLQERTVRRLGDDRDQPIDVRVVAATNADLEDEMETGRFRKDLYFRLATIVVGLPPLRERREDIAPLAAGLLERLEVKGGRKAGLSPRALERLAAYDWPGNVRELGHLLERASVMADSTVIGPKDLPLPDPNEESGERVETLEEVERAHVVRVLSLAGGNKKKAAKLLGLPRATLYRKLEKYGLSTPEGPEKAEPGREAEGPDRLPEAPIGA